MRAGASDYVLKDNLVRLGPALAREVLAADNRRAQRKAQKLVSRLAAIVESSDDAIISCTLDGTITDFNAGAERLYGYSAAEVVGLTNPPFVPADRFAERHAALARLGRGERVEPLEAVRYRRDGTRVDVVVSVSPMRDAEGRVYQRFFCRSSFYIFVRRVPVFPSGAASFRHLYFDREALAPLSGSAIVVLAAGAALLWSYSTQTITQ